MISQTFLPRRECELLSCPFTMPRVTKNVMGGVLGKEVTMASENVKNIIKSGYKVVG